MYFSPYQRLESFSLSVVKFHTRNNRPNACLEYYPFLRSCPVNFLLLTDYHHRITVAFKRINFFLLSIDFSLYIVPYIVPNRYLGRRTNKLKVRYPFNERNRSSTRCKREGELCETRSFLFSGPPKQQTTVSVLLYRISRNLHTHRIIHGSRRKREYSRSASASNRSASIRRSRRH